MKTFELSVPNMSCGHCVESVASALRGVDGVTQAEVSLAGKKATVHADDAVVDGALLNAVRQAGYSATVLRRG
jgi:copper chaperone CopZ